MEDEEEECCVPGLVDLPAKARQISAGDSHTAAVTEGGHVYIWGTFRDSSGSFGLTIIAVPGFENLKNLQY